MEAGDTLLTKLLHYIRCVQLWMCQVIVNLCVTNQLVRSNVQTLLLQRGKDEHDAGNGKTSMKSFSINKQRLICESNLNDG